MPGGQSDRHKKMCPFRVIRQRFPLANGNLKASVRIEVGLKEQHAECGTFRTDSLLQAVRWVSTYFWFLSRSNHAITLIETLRDWPQAGNPVGGALIFARLRRESTSTKEIAKAARSG